MEENTPLDKIIKPVEYKHKELSMTESHNEKNINKGSIDLQYTFETPASTSSNKNSVKKINDAKKQYIKDQIKFHNKKIKELEESLNQLKERESE